MSNKLHRSSKSERVYNKAISQYKRQMNKKQIVNTKISWLGVGVVFLILGAGTYLLCTLIIKAVEWVTQ